MLNVRLFLILLLFTSVASDFMLPLGNVVEVMQSQLRSVTKNAVGSLTTGQHEDQNEEFAEGCLDSCVLCHSGHRTFIIATYESAHYLQSSVPLFFQNQSLISLEIISRIYRPPIS